MAEASGKIENLNELRELIEALKESIIELRSALSEINNPFKIMKEDDNSDDEEENKQQESPLPLSASPLVAPYPINIESYTNTYNKNNRKTNETFDSRKEENKENSTYNESESRLDNVKMTSEEVIDKLKSTYSNSINFSKLTKFLRAVYIIRSRLPREAVENVVDILVSMNLIKSKEKDLALKLIDFIDKTKDQGLTPEDGIVVIYAIAKSLGVVDDLLEDEAYKAILAKIAGG